MRSARTLAGIRLTLGPGHLGPMITRFCSQVETLLLCGLLAEDKTRSPSPPPGATSFPCTFMCTLVQFHHIEKEGQRPSFAMFSSLLIYNIVTILDSVTP